MSDSGRHSRDESTKRLEEEGQHTLFQTEVDALFDCLSHRDRRVVLLLVHQGAVDSVADLKRLRANTPTLGAVALEHQHLPKLAEAELITWNRKTGAISKGPMFPDIAPLLDCLVDHADELPADWG